MFVSFIDILVTNKCDSDNPLHSEVASEALRIVVSFVDCCFIC